MKTAGSKEVLRHVLLVKNKTCNKGNFLKWKIVLVSSWRIKRSLYRKSNKFLDETCQSCLLVRVKRMESETLKFICANTGSVDVDVLMSHLFQGESMVKILSNQKKFVLHSSDGRQKVVARTSLKLCRVKDCQGPCGGLHLCKHFLFNGLCHKNER